MSRDPELSRLKVEMDRLFDLKQIAYQEMKDAGRERARAKDDLDSAWNRVQSAREDMNNAFEERQREWDNFKSELDRLSHAIDEASETANYYHGRMQSLFEEAHNAYEYGDKADAASYSAEAHEYRELRDQYNAEKSELIAERRNVQKPSDNNFNYYKSAYEQEKQNHEHYQNVYHDKKEAHESAKEKFEDAKVAHENALETYRAKKVELLGMTIYDRQARSSHTPVTGAGYMYVRGKKAGYGHSTQVYSDGYRISRSTNDGGKTANHVHWTNQNTKKGSTNRHTKPADANY
jgi:chromosome segregation ATPase